MHEYFEDVGRLPEKHLCSICGYGPQSEYHFPRDVPKQLLVKEVIDRYPRMLGLLKAAEPWIAKGIEKGAYVDCAGPSQADRLLEKIQALLAEVEK